MIRIVVDASVAVKWLLPQRKDEADSAAALRLLREFVAGRLELQQPPHWLAEVAAVVTRLSPETAADDVSDLVEMKIDTVASRNVYLVAVELARRLDHHLFDTLYHAVALTQPSATLVTADARYFRKARGHGAIALLSDFGVA